MNSIFHSLKKEISEDMKTLEATLLSNRVEGIEHYRFLAGQLRGLTVALNRVKDLEAKVEKDSDWDN